MLPHPVLLADIGGTYVRFAVLPAPGACPGPIRKVPTAGFPGPIAALQAYLDGPGTPRPRLPSSPLRGVSTGTSRA